MDNNQNFNNDYNDTYSAYTSTPLRTPGKDISTLVCGIHALYFGAFGILFCWHPIIGIVFGFLAICCAIATFVLHNTIQKQTGIITKKPEIGQKLAIAGIICGGLAILLDIIAIIVFAIMGVSGMAIEMLNELSMIGFFL